MIIFRFILVLQLIASTALGQSQPQGSGLAPSLKKLNATFARVQNWDDFGPKAGLGRADLEFYKTYIEKNNLKGPVPKVNILGVVAKIGNESFSFFPIPNGAAIYYENRMRLYLKSASLRENVDSLRGLFEQNQSQAAQTRPSWINEFMPISTAYAAGVVPAPPQAMALALAVMAVVFIGSSAWGYVQSVNAMASAQVWSDAKRISKINCSDDGRLISAEDVMALPSPEVMRSEGKKCVESAEQGFSKKEKDTAAAQDSISAGCKMESFLKANHNSRFGISSKLEFKVEPPTLTRSYMWKGNWKAGPSEAIEPNGLDSSKIMDFLRGVGSYIKKGVTGADATLTAIQADAKKKSLGALFRSLEAYCAGNSSVKAVYDSFIKENKKYVLVTPSGMQRGSGEASLDAGVPVLEAE